MAGNVDQEADDETAARTLWLTRSGSEGKQEDPVPSSQLLCCVDDGAYAGAFVCTPFAFLSLCIWNAPFGGPLWHRLRKAEQSGGILFCVVCSGAISSLISDTLIEFSVRSGNHSTGTLSFVQNRVRFRKKKTKTPAKKYISLQGERGWNSEMNHFFLGGKLSFILFSTPISFFLSASTAAT